MPYRSAHPALPPLADAGAQASLASCSAPPIAAGAPLSLQHVHDATFELGVKRARPEGVTQDEQAEAKLRLVGIELEDIDAAGAGLAGMPGAMAALTNQVAALTNQVAALTNQVAAVAGVPAQVAALTNQVAALAGLPAQVAAVDAQVFNMRARTENGSIHDENAPLTPLQKAVPGLGVALPGIVVPVLAPLNVGQVPPSFPATLLQLDGMTRPQIIGLSVAFNDSFGIVAGATAAQMRTALRRFVRGFP